MIRYIFLFFFVYCSQMQATETVIIQTEQKNKAAMPLQGEDHFLVYYAFEKLEGPLKDAMIACFKQIGTVYSGDVSKLSEKEKEERTKPGPMIEIVFSSVIEEKSYSSLEHIKLPVMEMSLQVLTGAEVLKNGHKQGCTLWSLEKFLGTTSKEFKEKALKTFKSMMTQFITEYQKANPDKKNTGVCFYLYS